MEEERKQGRGEGSEKGREREGRKGEGKKGGKEREINEFTQNRFLTLNKTKILRSEYERLETV